MITPTTMTAKDLQGKIAGRPVYLWGARHDGYSMCCVLKRLGIRIEGFIDSSPSLKGKTALGYHIYLAREFFQKTFPDVTPFIVITSGFYADEVAEECSKHGLKKKKDFIIFSEIQTFDYQVDVSGVCNLRCISCPRGNYPQQPKAGFMSARVYEKVVHKILTEDPYTGIITLYNWGEPLLNPELSEIIRITHDKGLLSAISSNLCLKTDFSEVIKAAPTWFRVSTSGWGDNYEITHTGGEWKLFYQNMLRLRELKEHYHPQMLVEVFYHIYNHNNQDDFHKMKTLCDTLGFTLRYRHAALAPLDNIESIIEGRQLSKEAEKTRQLQILDVEEAMQIARQEKERPCFYKRCLWITWDLRVAQCMEWYKPDLSLVENNFLSVPLSEIIAARNHNTFCQKCQERAIHRCYNVYGDEKLIYQKKSLNISGSDYETA